MTKKRRLAYLALLINVLIWGAALPIVKPSLLYISAFGFLFFRYLIAAPLMLPWLLSGLLKKRVNVHKLVQISALEIFGSAIPLTLLYLGLELTSSIDASLLGATTPLFVTLAAIFILREKEEKREWLGLTFAIVGTAVIAIEPLLSGNTTPTSSLTGNLLIIAYNIMTTLYLITAKRYYKNTPKTLVTSISSFISLIFFTILGLAYTGLPNISLLGVREVALACFYMGILGTPVAFTMYMYGQDLIEASEASLFSYLTGPVAIPVAMILLNEIPTPVQILAVVIIFFGVFLAEIRPRAQR